MRILEEEEVKAKKAAWNDDAVDDDDESIFSAQLNSLIYIGNGYQGFQN